MFTEFGLIEKFKKLFPSRGRRIRLGVGDDAAVLAWGEENLLFTCDAVVEDVHFSLNYFSFFDAGWRLAAGNLSDIAAMGGKPRAAVVALGVRKGVSEKDILEAYKGISALLSKFGCSIAGGDIVRSKEFFMDMAILGVAGRRYFTRSGARPGELVVVTGELGRSLLGFKLLAKAKKRSMSILTEKHLRPFPRLLESGFLASRIKVGGMIDISDGLSSELHHLREESGVGFEIEEEKLPLHPTLAKKSKEFGLSATQLALRSGEEYELLFTCPVREEQKLLAWNRAHRKVPFTIIGRTVKSPTKVFLKKQSGKIAEAAPTGYRHF
ncbi:MAG: thiamine-phosphate kinase [candidate division Zixibacteria bacterium]|nr:thiamine-phosphate kinase [candidate division Zixibacteria bacterium]MCI0595183.1 thiamine-phosphate kinase [candidate division Zixibacteria bacterium]